MRIVLHIEIGDRLVFQEGRGTAYEKWWGRPFTVSGGNIHELSIIFDDTEEYARVSRDTVARVCRPVDFPTKEWSLR